MDIEGLGSKTVEQLADAGLLESLSSIYHLRKEDLTALERIGDKNADNLLSEIEATKDRPLSRFLYGLGIPLVGEHLVRILASHFETLGDLMGASEENLREIREIGPEAARSVATFFADEQNRREIEKMRNAGLEFPNPDYRKEGEPRPLEDVNIVFTGSLERWTRDEAEELVESLGGRTTSSVSGNTDYVVAGEGTGSKLDEATELDIPVIDEEEFASFLRERGVDEVS